MVSGGQRTDTRVPGVLGAGGVYLLLTAAVMAQSPARTLAPATGSRVTTQPAYSRRRAHLSCWPRGGSRKCRPK